MSGDGGSSTGTQGHYADRVDILRETAAEARKTREEENLSAGNECVRSLFNLVMADAERKMSGAARNGDESTTLSYELPCKLYRENEAAAARAFEVALAKKSYHGVRARVTSYQRFTQDPPLPPRQNAGTHCEIHLDWRKRFFGW